MVNYVNTFPGRTLNVDNKEFLYFGGTAYLGLQTHSDFQALFIKNIKQYGTNYGASRKSNVQLPIFEVAEHYLSSLVGSETCITLSSGYLAGQFIASYFNTSHYNLFYTPSAHSALHQGSGCITNDYKELAVLIQRTLREHPEKTPVVFLDAIDFLGQNHPSYADLKTIPLEHIILVVDDSHGIGIVGENGSGTYPALRSLPTIKTLVCASLGKGFGIQAGAIFGDKNTLDPMRDTAFYGGASPASPAALATMVQATTIFNQQRKILKGHMHHFWENVKEKSTFKTLEGHPTYSFYDPSLVKHLGHHNIIITDFRYPNEDEGVMSRMVLSAHHHEGDIEKLANTLNAYF
jgi:7-keto-8-aminopelargonate synthetase-like enzyme